MSGLCVVICIFSAVGIFGSNDVDSTIYPVGDPRRCHLGNGDAKYRFEVLPGGGWDNLRNKDMGMVVEFNYSKCRTSDDGRYLLPDNVYTIPLKSSNVETFAELFTHWDDYTRYMLTVYFYYYNFCGFKS